MNDVELGRQALIYFHNASLKYSEYGSKSIEDFIGLYGAKAQIYMDGIGGLIRELKLSDGQVQSVMKTLAEKTKGKIPKDHQAYMNALGNKAGEISYLDLSKTVITEVASKVTEGAVALGDSVMTSMSWLTKLLPFLLIGGVVFYIYSFSKNNSTVSKETMDSLKGAAKRTAAKIKEKVKKAKA